MSGHLQSLSSHAHVFIQVFLAPWDKSSKLTEAQQDHWLRPPASPHPRCLFWLPALTQPAATSSPHVCGFSGEPVLNPHAPCDPRPRLLMDWQPRPQTGCLCLSTLQLASSGLSMSKGTRRPRQTGADQEERRGPDSVPEGHPGARSQAPSRGSPPPKPGGGPASKRITRERGSPALPAAPEVLPGVNKGMVTHRHCGCQDRPLCKTTLRTQARKRSVRSLVVLSCPEEESCDSRLWSGTTGLALSPGGIEHFLLSLNLEARKVKSVSRSCAGSHCSPTDLSRHLQGPSPRGASGDSF